MATDVESLIVSLDAKVSGYIEKMEKAERASKGTEVGILKVGKATFAMGAQVVTAAATAGAALAAFTVATAANRREQELLAAQAQTTVENLNAIAFATRQVGIDAEKFGDISKDLSDRLGEFATAGTGPFQDFADVMGMTREEAVELSKEFQGMSSEEVLGAMISQMEAAGATGEQMTFVMESMAGDASRLIPLFASQSEELNTLKQRYEDATAGMELTQEQAQSLAETATSFDLLTTQLGAAAQAVSATLAPVFNEFFNSVIAVVPDATQVIVDFINTFLEAEQIESVAALDRQIVSLTEEMDALALAARQVEQAQNAETVSEQIRLSQGLTDATYLQAAAYHENKERLAELNEQREKLLENQKALEDAASGQGGTISGGDGTFQGGEGGSTTLDQTEESEAIQARLAAFEQSQRDKEDLLWEQYEIEKQILDQTIEDEAERERLKLELKREANAEALAIRQEAAEAEAKILEDQIRQQDRANRDSSRKADQDARSTERREAALVRQLGRIDKDAAMAAHLISQQKEIGAAAMATHRAVAEAMPNPIAMAWAAATGAAEIAAIAGITFGSSSSSGAASSSGVPSEPGGSIEVSGFTGAGGTATGTAGTVTFSAEDSDELANAFANVMNSKIRNGQLPPLG